MAKAMLLRKERPEDWKDFKAKHTEAPQSASGRDGNRNVFQVHMEEPRAQGPQGKILCILGELHDDTNIYDPTFHGENLTYTKNCYRLTQQIQLCFPILKFLFWHSILAYIYLCHFGQPQGKKMYSKLIFSRTTESKCLK